MSLRQRAFSATLWSGADIFIRQGLQFGVSIVLARLLSPEEFGTIALLALFIGLAGVFVDSGFSTALIQRQDITHDDESTVFWFNLGMGAVAALTLCAAAPTIASFYEIPLLVPLTAVMAFNVLISALGSIHGTLLTKRLEFRVQMNVGAAASLVSGVIAIWMAFEGFGVWALAIQTVIASVCTTVLLWKVNPWRPKLVFSCRSARKLFGFGGYLMASSLLDTLYSRLYTVFIGKIFGVRELGFYNRADSTKQLPVGVLSGILSRVALPIFSSAAGDIKQLRMGVRLSVRMLMLINVPLMLGLAALSEPATLALFGPVWTPSAPILSVLCLAGIFWPLHVINLNVLMAQGHSQLFFRLEVAKKIMGVLLLLIAVPFGVMGIAWSSVLFSIIAFVINAYYTGRFLDYGMADQVSDFAHTSLLAGVMASVVFFLSRLWQPHPAVKFVVLAALGAGIYALLGFIFRLRSFIDAANFLRNWVTVK